MMEKKKVFIDFHYLKNLNKGFGQFSYHLSKKLMESRSNIKYVFYIPKKKYFINLFKKSNNITTKYYFTFHRQFGVFGKKIVFHSTNQLGKIEPINKQIPYILTIHDVNFIYDKNIDEKLKNRIQKKINRANAIVYVSKFTKGEVNNFFNIRSSTIQKVIYNGNSLKDITIVKDKTLNFKYLFSITEMRPYKNLEKLILMMVDLPNAYKLILAGKSSKSYLKQLIDIVKHNNLEDRVIIKGIISEQEKIRLLSNCSAFVFPSSREGFGLPIIEALNFNIPVFASNMTSLPEVGGDACFYWKELNTKKMASFFLKNIKYFYDNEDEMRKIIKLQLAKFDWGLAANQYEELYKSFI